MRPVALAFAIAGVVSFGGCKKESAWSTKSGEADLMLVREYTAPAAAAPAWVVRLDLTPAHPTSWSQHWLEDDLDFQVHTTHGVFAAGMTCHAAERTFSCDGREFDAAKGRVITYQVDAHGRIDHPVQTDLASYKPLR
jgi:hypothetical protein